MSNENSGQIDGNITKADPLSVGDLAGLSKPATTLIERISNGIGALYEPHHVRRMAKAKADAMLILAGTENKISENQARALERLAVREIKHEQNIAKITRDAAQNLSDNAKPEDIDEDWLSHYIEKAKMFTNEEMQQL